MGVYMDVDWLGEQLKTIHNLAEISLVLYNLGKTELLPTVLELLAIELQTVLEEHCIVDK